MSRVNFGLFAPVRLALAHQDGSEGNVRLRLDEKQRERKLSGSFQLSLRCLYNSLALFSYLIWHKIDI